MRYDPRVVCITGALRTGPRHANEEVGRNLATRASSSLLSNAKIGDASLVFAKSRARFARDGTKIPLRPRKGYRCYVLRLSLA